MVLINENASGMNLFRKKKQQNMSYINMRTEQNKPPNADKQKPREA